MKAKPDKIVPGDSVILRSGASPLMTAEKADQKGVSCVWFERSGDSWTLRRELIFAGALNKTDPPTQNSRPLPSESAP